MSKIQQARAVGNSATPEAPQIPDGWAQVPHSVARDSTVSPAARLLWVILEGRQGQRAHARVGLRVLAADMGADSRSVKRWLVELTAAGLLSIKRTGRTNMYTVLKQVEIGQQRPIRGDTCVPSTEQETLRKKKAGHIPAIGTERHAQRDTLEPAAALVHSLEIELFLNAAGQYFPQIPGATRKVAETLGALFGKGWGTQELIKELQRSITNPQAGAGLIVTELERLAATPRQESYTATHTPTKATHQYEELEEAWGTVEPQEQADQYEENSQEWIETIRADLNQRNRKKIS
jgi:hypothetical protein